MENVTLIQQVHGQLNFGDVVSRHHTLLTTNNITGKPFQQYSISTLSRCTRPDQSSPGSGSKLLSRDGTLLNGSMSDPGSKTPEHPIPSIDRSLARHGPILAVRPSKQRSDFRYCTVSPVRYSLSLLSTTFILLQNQAQAPKRYSACGCATPIIANITSR